MQTADSAPASPSFLRLSDWKTSESLFVDPLQISFIRQFAACEQFPRRTLIIVESAHLMVAESASEIAAATGRTFVCV
jgi:hypothetical protein